MAECVSDAPCAMPLFSVGLRCTSAVKSDHTVWALGHNNHGERVRWSSLGGHRHYGVSHANEGVTDRHPRMTGGFAGYGK